MKALTDLLDDEINGCHGESERRAAAHFVRDALDEDDTTEMAAGLAESLAKACSKLAKRIRRLNTSTPLNARQMQILGLALSYAFSNSDDLGEVVGLHIDENEINSLATALGLPSIT